MLEDALHSLNLRVSVITVQREAMVHIYLSHEPWDAPKAIDWEHLIGIIGLEDGPNSLDGLFVLVEGIQVMEGLGVADLTVGASEIYGDHETDAPAGPEVVHKVRDLHDIQVVHGNSAGLLEGAGVDQGELLPVG